MKTEKQSARFRIGIISLTLLVTIGISKAQERYFVQPVENSYVLVDNDHVKQAPYVIHPPSSIALKTNLLYLATLTPNLALEIGLGKKMTLEIGGGYNFYDPDNQKHWKHWLIRPELRYWFCERFNGSFLGVHALGGEYNFSKINLPLSVFDDLDENRYEGHFYGGGLVFGHQWILSKRWNFELSLGVGYVRVHYDKYPCTSCGSSIDNGVKNYFGPTKATISFLFFL